MSDVATYEVPGPDRELLAAVVGTPADDRPITLRTPNGMVELPPAASAAVRRLLAELASGTAVHLISEDAELTTQEAADLLGLSRTYVVHLVDTGKLAGHRVGTHRRLRAADVLAYRARRDARLAAVDEIAAGDPAVGVPYR